MQPLSAQQQQKQASEFIYLYESGSALRTMSMGLRYVVVLLLLRAHLTSHTLALSLHQPRFDQDQDHPAYHELGLTHAPCSHAITSPYRAEQRTSTAVPLLPGTLTHSLAHALARRRHLSCAQPANPVPLLRRTSSDTKMRASLGNHSDAAFNAFPPPASPTPDRVEPTSPSSESHPKVQLPIAPMTASEPSLVLGRAAAATAAVTLIEPLAKLALETDSPATVVNAINFRNPIKLTPRRSHTITVYVRTSSHCRCDCRRC